MRDEEQARRRRILGRAVFGIATEISRFRSGSSTISDLESRVDVWVGSMSEVVDPEHFETWRREANRIEFVNASMIDEGRTGSTPEENETIQETLATLEVMCRPWTDLDDLERRVLEMLVAGDEPRMRRLQAQLAVCRVRDRDMTGVGFFTTLHVDRSAAEPLDVASARLGDVSAEMEGVRHGAGFQLTIDEGYLDELEGYTFDDPWPDEVHGLTLAYVEQLRDRGALASNRPGSAPAVHQDPGDVVAGDPQERSERPHEG
ncbi:MAG TPA: hypothetical protein VE800_00085 [Actinomycetota bacterium]|nr:hypothetical protein [Actinomycetota bacterium]